MDDLCTSQPLSAAHAHATYYGSVVPRLRAVKRSCIRAIRSVSRRLLGSDLRLRSGISMRFLRSCGGVLLTYGS